MIDVTVQTFGVFRTFGPTVRLSVPEGAGLHDLREALIDQLGPEQRLLVLDSVFSDEHSILKGDYIIRSDQVLSILPPVCGG